ncbi:MAG: hypothetical protein ACFCUE_08895 [Candidatus Bathyarchaeia archaeon]
MCTVCNVLALSNYSTLCGDADKLNRMDVPGSASKGIAYHCRATGTVCGCAPSV